MIFLMHRNKIYLALLILLLFHPDVFALSSVMQQLGTASEHYTWRKSDYQHLFFQNAKTIDQYTFKTFNKFYYEEIKGHTMTSKYVRALTRRLLTQSLYLEAIRNTAPALPKSTSPVTYGETPPDVEDIEKIILINSLWIAGMEVIELTSLYQKFKYYRYEIGKYFFMEYSKSLSDTKPELYLPGAISDAKKKEKKEYKLSFSSLLEPDNESYKLDLSANIITLFSNIKSKLSYSVRRRNTSFYTSNTLLNSYLNADLKLGIQNISKGDKVYGLSLDYAF